MINPPGPGMPTVSHVSYLGVMDAHFVADRQRCGWSVHHRTSAVKVKNLLLDHCHDRWWWLICLVLWISLALFLPQLLSLLLFHVISMFKQWNKTMQPLLLGPHLSFILRPTFEAMEATNQEANPDRSVYRYLKRKTVRRSISDYKCVKCGKCAKNTLNLG